MISIFFFFFSSRRRHTRCYRDWSSDVCSSDLQWQRRVSACGEQEMPPKRQVLQEKGQTAMNRRGFNDVVVIQHESEVSSIMDHEVVGEQSNDGLRRRWLRHLEQGERGGTDMGVECLQGGNHVREETYWFIVLRLKREPGDRR